MTAVDSMDLFDLGLLCLMCDPRQITGSDFWISPNGDDWHRLTFTEKHWWKQMNDNGIMFTNIERLWQIPNNCIVYTGPRQFCNINDWSQMKKPHWFLQCK